MVFGAAAGVWTENRRTALTVSERLRAGAVWVNTYCAVSFMAPFGGCKRGQEAIMECLQTECVWISTAGEVPNPFVMR